MANPTVSFFTKSIHVKVDPDLLLGAKKLAKTRGVNLSIFVRDAIISAITNHEINTGFKLTKRNLKRHAK